MRLTNLNKEVKRLKEAIQFSVCNRAKVRKFLLNSDFPNNLLINNNQVIRLLCLIILRMHAQTHLTSSSS